MITNKSIDTLTLKPARIAQRVFICDFCGKEKSGKKYSIFDENWNQERGVYQCEDCFKEQCDSQ